MAEYFLSTLIYFHEPRGVKIRPESELSSHITQTSQKLYCFSLVPGSISLHKYGIGDPITGKLYDHLNIFCIPVVKHAVLKGKKVGPDLPTYVPPLPNLLKSNNYITCFV